MEAKVSLSSKDVDKIVKQHVEEQLKKTVRSVVAQAGLEYQYEAGASASVPVFKGYEVIVEI